MAFYISKKSIPRNTPIWAFAYSIDNETGYCHLRCKPTLGEIVDISCYKAKFFPYKKGTNEKRKSGEVDYTARRYADTETEAIAAYNKLVQDRIDRLNNLAMEASKDKIK